MAKLITVAGDVQDFSMPVEGAPVQRLRVVQDAIGGYVEVAPLPGAGALLVDEEGLLKKRPLNEAASALMGRRIVGDVIACTDEELRRWDEEGSEA